MGGCWCGRVLVWEGAGVGGCWVWEGAGVGGCWCRRVLVDALTVPSLLAVPRASAVGKNLTWLTGAS